MHNGPLHFAERGAGFANLCDSNGGCNVMSSSVVGVVGHRCGRVVIDPLGLMVCWLGWVVGAEK
jgi:hypothetical protein